MVDPTPEEIAKVRAWEAARGDAFEGFAKCVNPDCGHIEQDGTLVGLFDVLRPILLVRDVKQVKGTNGDGDLFSNMVLNETEYVHPANDADLDCPECRMPCALLPGKPITFRRQYGDYAAR